MKSFSRICFLATGMLLCYAASRAQGAHVQTATNFINNPGSGVISATFGGNSTTNNLIVVSVTYSGVGIQVRTSPVGVTDSKGNVYAKIVGPTNWQANTWRGELWYAYAITGGAGAITVTVTLTGTPPNSGGLAYSQVYISEFSGIRSASNPLDVFAASQGTMAGAGAFNSGGGASPTNYSNELIYGSAVGQGPGTINNSVAAPAFTSASGANGNRVEFRNQAAGNTSVQANFNMVGGGGAYYVNMATFRSTTSVLPVKLRSFDANAQSNGSVRLDWVTESEINNDYFEVQRSTDGTSWEPMKTVKGAGNSSSIIHYTETDASPVAPVTYYRLRQVDYNKSSEYSSIQRVDIAGSEKMLIQVHPNPTTEWLYVDGAESSLKEIAVFNVIGVNVGNQISDIVERDGGISINVANLHAGLYILHVGKTAVKFYKQ